MVKYYRIYNSVFEDIGHNTLRCIASYRKNMVDVLWINPEPNAPMYPCDSREMALASLKEDAYWDNAEVFEG